MPTYKRFKKFNSLDQAQDFVYHLKECDIPCSIQEINSPLGSSFGSTMNDRYYEISIPVTKVGRANEVAHRIAEIAINNAEKDHYLFDFSNEELKEIQKFPNDWSEFDVQLSARILKERSSAIPFGTSTSRVQTEPLREGIDIFKKKKRTGWDKFNYVKFINVPEPKSIPDQLSPLTILVSKRKSRETALFFLLVLIIVIVISITRENDLKDIAIIGGIIGLAITVHIIGMFNKKPQLILTTEDIQIKKKIIRWSAVNEIYIRIQNNGDNDFTELIVKTDNDYINHSTECLNLEPKQILCEIGAFYSYWLRKNTPISALSTPRVKY